MPPRAVPRIPAAHDHYIVFLRAVSVVVIVLGHWLIGVVWWRGEQIGVHNMIGATSWLWPMTWVVQALPMFFFAEGAVSFEVYRSQRAEPGSYREFLALRTRGVVRPILIFGALWAVAELGLHVLDVGTGIIRGSLLPFVPLWLMFVYLGVVALTPALHALHRRFGLLVPAALVLLAALVDLLRFWPNVPAVGWLNLGFVWLFAHQLGFFYADGWLVPARARVLLIGGLGTLVVLTNLNVYPRSMLGTDVGLPSNLNPPTLCVVALSASFAGLAVLMRERVATWLRRDRIWAAVAATDRGIVTIYLWHLTAYLLAIVMLYPLGLGRLGGWWIQRPVWLAAPAVMLGGLVALVGRFESPHPQPGANLWWHAEPDDTDRR